MSEMKVFMAADPKPEPKPVPHAPPPQPPISKPLPILAFAVLTLALVGSVVYYEVKFQQQQKRIGALEDEIFYFTEMDVNGRGVKTDRGYAHSHIKSMEAYEKDTRTIARESERRLDAIANALRRGE